MLPRKRVPTRAGDLSEEFLKPHKVTQVAIADHLGIPAGRVDELVRAG